MRTKQHISHRTVPIVNILALAVIILFSWSNKTFAQQWNTNGNDISNTNSGNVGVGTTSPGVKLDILSSVALIARFNSTASSDTQVLIDASSTKNSNLTLQRGGASKWFMGNRAANDRLSFLESTGNVEVLTLMQNGNVGVGTSNPQDPFHLFSTTNAVGTMRFQGGNTNAAFIGMWDPGQMFLLTNNRHPGTGNNFNSAAAGSQLAMWGGDIVFHSTTSGTVGTSIETLRVKADGKVGIGTATPGYRLDVQGGSINSSGGLCIAGDCKTSWSQVGGAVSSVFGRTGAVVAATNDYTWAQINKSTSSLADITTRNAGDLNAGTVPLERLGVSGTASASTFLRGDNTWAAVTSSQWISGTNNISYSSGNVGIGTVPASQYTLDINGNTNVNGNINVTGNINAKYQDLAEWVESSQVLPTGTLVVLDHTKANQVIASSQAYDSRVAGVISERPGIALGEAGDNKVLVATTGRVKLMVDASNGPIQIGDLLVTSEIPGVAMKSEAIDVGGVRIHRPGTLVGKALEPLAKGQGKILVLLSLQ